VNEPAENFSALRRALPASVTLVGVTKAQPSERIENAVAAGLADLGNNYAQEGEALRERVRGARWHFIGHIQSRKVKYLVNYDWVQSLDRIEIVADLHARLEKLDRTIDGLVEVNIGDEASKSGIAPEALAGFVQAMRAYPRVRCRGMMAMPPPLHPVEERRLSFRRARALFESVNAPGWDALSMGTSEDYELAVAEGSTMVRLGTVLFGSRAC
jgi:pyridoxal phosphate enzyme (YggS family)